MIIDVEKYLFVGVREELNRFFDKARDEGCFEFISPTPKKAAPLPQHIQHLIDAIKILRKQPVIEAVEEVDGKALGMHLAEKILDLNRDIEHYLERKRIIAAEISRIAIYGDFSLDDIAYIEKEGKRVVQFFCVNSSKRKKIEVPEECIYVGTAYDLDYFITINEEKSSYPGMIEIHIEKPLGALKKEHEHTAAAIHEKQTELKKQAVHLEFLREIFLEEINEMHLTRSKKMADFPIDNQVFAIEAWVPKNRLVALEKLSSKMAIHYEKIAVEKEDRVPTHMENKGTNAIGEDLVKVYDIPNPKDKDPSGWVLWAFTLFFAIIVADGGYGLLYLSLALFLKFKFPRLKDFKKRFVNLCIILSTACILWGLATTSFFGIQISKDSFLSKISLIHYVAEKKADYHIEQKDDVYDKWIQKYPDLATRDTGDQFLEEPVLPSGQKVGPVVFNEFSDYILLDFSLLLGVIHISIGLLRYARRNWAAIGWFIFIIGGYLFFPSMLNATSMINFLGIVGKEIATAVGLQLVYGGITLAVLLALIQKRWKGIGEIANVVGVFSDVLSYLRLYALALASSIMARTFNELGLTVGLAAGFIILILGHGINISLGIVGGIIHGLRLNFIEWYHYSFDGGGKLFQPLRKLHKPTKE